MPHFTHTASHVTRFIAGIIFLPHFYALTPVDARILVSMLSVENPYHTIPYHPSQPPFPTARVGVELEFVE